MIIYIWKLIEFILAVLIDICIGSRTPSPLDKNKAKLSPHQDHDPYSQSPPGQHPTRTTANQ